MYFKCSIVILLRQVLCGVQALDWAWARYRMCNILCKPRNGPGSPRREIRTNNGNNGTGKSPVVVFTRCYHYWLVVWLPSILFSHILGIIIPIDGLIFFRGVQTTNQIIYTIFWPSISKYWYGIDGCTYMCAIIIYHLSVHSGSFWELMQVFRHHGASLRMQLVCLLACPRLAWSVLPGSWGPNLWSGNHMQNPVAVSLKVQKFLRWSQHIPTYPIHLDRIDPSRRWDQAEMRLSTWFCSIEFDG